MATKLNKTQTEILRQAVKVHPRLLRFSGRQLSTYRSMQDKGLLFCADCDPNDPQDVDAQITPYGAAEAVNLNLVPAKDDNFVSNAIALYKKEGKRFHRSQAARAEKVHRPDDKLTANEGKELKHAYEHFPTPIVYMTGREMRVYNSLEERGMMYCEVGVSLGCASVISATTDQPAVIAHITPYGAMMADSLLRKGKDAKVPEAKMGKIRRQYRSITGATQKTGDQPAPLRKAQKARKAAAAKTARSGKYKSNPGRHNARPGLKVSVPSKDGKKRIKGVVERVNKDTLRVRTSGSTRTVSNKEIVIYKAQPKISDTKAAPKKSTARKSTAKKSTAKRAAPKRRRTTSTRVGKVGTHVSIPAAGGRKGRIKGHIIRVNKDTYRVETRGSTRTVSKKDTNILKSQWPPTRRRKTTSTKSTTKASGTKKRKSAPRRVLRNAARYKAAEREFDYGSRRSKGKKRSIVSSSVGARRGHLRRSSATGLSEPQAEVLEMVYGYDQTIDSNGARIPMSERGVHLGDLPTSRRRTVKALVEKDLVFYDLRGTKRAGKRQFVRLTPSGRFLVRDALNTAPKSRTANPRSRTANPSSGFMRKPWVVAESVVLRDGKVVHKGDCVETFEPEIDMYPMVEGKITSIRINEDTYEEAVKAGGDWHDPIHLYASPPRSGKCVKGPRREEKFKRGREAWEKLGMPPLRKRKSRTRRK